ncbi:MAG TPA: Crp/Fnr family transcriptional regulator [Blastocatellia bacterium]|nr:Crp/Fnr family transcriptional regulator [Blastocatellia bacterium]
MSKSDKSRPPIENRLLATLPAEEYERLRPHLEPVTLKLRDVLYREGDIIRHAWFPHTAMVSLVSVMNTNRRIEVGLVGSEGMVSTVSFMGGETATSDAIVQIQNGAARMEAGVLREEFRRGGVLQELLLRYAQSLYVQVSQTAACNRLHSMDERLARWLLMTRDRARTDELELTQEFLAIMLGSERSGVTLAAIALQDAELIKYSRGKITLLNRKKLEAASCECYEKVRKFSDHVLKV